MGKMQCKMHCKVQCKRLELMLYRIFNFFVFVQIFRVCFMFRLGAIVFVSIYTKHEVFVFCVPNSGWKYWALKRLPFVKTVNDVQVLHLHRRHYTVYFATIHVDAFHDIVNTRRAYSLIGTNHTNGEILRFNFIFYPLNKK